MKGARIARLADERRTPAPQATLRHGRPPQQYGLVFIWTLRGMKEKGGPPLSWQCSLVV